MFTLLRQHPESPATEQSPSPRSGSGKSLIGRAVVAASADLPPSPPVKASCVLAGAAAVSGAEQSRRLPSATTLLSLPVLVAFGLFTLPARAVPAASMQLFRMDGQGVRAVPAISAAIEAAARPLNAAPPSAPNGLLAQATGASTALDVLSQTFVAPLPSNLAGNIRLVFVAEDGTLGNILEEVPFSSPRVSITNGGTLLSVRPSTPIQPGQSVMLQLPSTAPDGTPYTYPDHLASTPCVFKVPLVSTTPTPAPVPVPAPAAAAAGLPVWVYIVGAVVVGFGVAAASGAFSSGGGGGGTNPSSQ